MQQAYKMPFQETCFVDWYRLSYLSNWKMNFSEKNYFVIYLFKKMQEICMLYNQLWLYENTVYLCKRTCDYLTLAMFNLCLMGQ